MATNEILRFAETDTGTNLLSQSEYLADAQRPIGNQPGVARSKLVNKALRQSSLIAAAVAQFIADNQANNVVDTADPADIADWIEAAVRSIGIPTAVAGGTADAITADFTPDVTLTNGTTVIVRAGAANTTTAPTFAPDGLAAKTIVKGNNLALVAGDIAGAGHWLEMNFDTALDKWVLANPASRVDINVLVWSTAGTFTYDKTVNDPRFVIVQVVGGGGGGGGADGGSGGSGGAGGGAGGNAISLLMGSALSASETITVGAGGARGGTGGTAGGSGGTTSFGTHLSATGGNGGTGGGSNSTSGTNRPSGGAAGIGIGGTILNAQGEPGMSTARLSGQVIAAGKGGSSALAGGGRSILSGGQSAGADGELGSGGGGGNSDGGTSVQGGRGGDGVVIIWEYK